MSQSSNDSFPTAMAYRRGARHRRQPDPALEAELHSRAAQEGKGVCKTRQDRANPTQDATPLTLGQEFSGYGRAVESGHRAALRVAVKDLFPLAQGGTADPATGLNSKPKFAKLVRQHVPD